MNTRYVTDGGLETELVFHRGFDLPEFAAFPLLDTTEGRAAMRDYYLGYVAIAIRAGAPINLETPTWRANPDHAATLGYDAEALDRVNRTAVDFLAEIAAERTDELVGHRISGMIGPRGDGYQSTSVDPDRAAAYHRPQLASLRSAGADRAVALTIADVGEAIGITRAAADVGIPVAIGFTVETDGRLPDGTPLSTAVTTVDAEAAPEYFLVNCAHPDHISQAIDDGAWRDRIGGLRVNASRLSHDELDAADTLDDGDPDELAAVQKPLLEQFGNVVELGGCCGTDARHVAAMWGV